MTGQMKKPTFSTTNKKKPPNFGWLIILGPLAIVICTVLFEASPWVAEHSQKGAEAEAENLCSWGRAMMKEGRFSDAILQFREALKIKPDFTEAAMSLGIAYHMNGDDERALTCLNAAIGMNPQKKDVIYNNLGLIYEKRGELDLAIENYHQAAESGLRAAKIWRNIGMAETQRENWDGVIDAYLRTIENRPTLQNLYLDMLREELGEEHNEDYIDDLTARLERGAIEADLVLFDSTIANLLLMTDVRLAEDYRCLGNAYEKLNRIDEALTAIREVVDIQPNRAQIYNRIALLHAGRKEIDEAEAAFRAALKIDPDNELARKGMDYLIPKLWHELEEERLKPPNAK